MGRCFGFYRLLGRGTGYMYIFWAAIFFGCCRMADNCVPVFITRFFPCTGRKNRRNDINKKQEYGDGLPHFFSNIELIVQRKNAGKILQVF